MLLGLRKDWKSLPTIACKFVGFNSKGDGNLSDWMCVLTDEDGKHFLKCFTVVEGLNETMVKLKAPISHLMNMKLSFYTEWMGDRESFSREYAKRNRQDMYTVDMFLSSKMIAVIE